MTVRKAEQYRDFPPKWSNIQVPLSSSTAALAGLALYSPCALRGTLMRDVVWWAASHLGPRLAIPGRSHSLAVPMPEDAWRDLLNTWKSEIGPFDTLAVHSRSQEHRSGFGVLLLRSGASPAFIRVSAQGADPFLQECRILQALAGAETGFWHPTVLTRGAARGWDYLAMTALPAQRHRQASRLRPGVLEDINVALARLPRSRGVPDHWEPMHGDLTPWNCRRLEDGRLAIFDWEDAGWGPPRADDVYFRATVAALTRADVGDGPEEAITYWRQRVKAAETRQPDDALQDRILLALDGMLNADRG